MKYLKNYFLLTILFSLIVPVISLADYSDTVKILNQVRSIESSAGDLLSGNSSLQQSFRSLYQGILNLLRAELLNIKTSITTSVSFNPIVSPLSKGSITTISFNRTPSESSSPINLFIETGDNRLLGSLANDVSSNSISWQVADGFAVDKTYRVVAKDGKNNLLGKTADFAVASATKDIKIISTIVPSVYVPSPEETISADVNRGSIGFWSFDKYSNSCNTKGGAITNAEGKVGSALGLNGTDSYCAVSNNKIFYPKYFTLAFWARSDSLTASAWNNSGWFVSSRDQSGFNVGPVKSSRNVQFTILDDTPITQIPYLVGTVTPDNITDWHHYAMTYNGYLASVYLDGVLATSTAVSISRSYAGTKDLYFGIDNSILDQHFGAGILDEIRLYNRALTTCEIQILAGKGCGGVSGLRGSPNNMAAILEAAESTLMRLRSLLRR